MNGKKIGLAAITIAAYVVFALAFFGYHKQMAEWFGINILFWAVAFVALVLYAATRFEWFRDRLHSSPWTLQVICSVGFVACLAMGLFFTEPQGNRASLAVYDYSQSRSGEFYFYYLGDVFGDVGTSVGSVNIDFDDDWGWVIFAIAVALFVLVLIIGSAFIPHFWVLACAALIAIMGLITYRELILKETSYEYGSD